MTQVIFTAELLNWRMITNTNTYNNFITICLWIKLTLYRSKTSNPQEIFIVVFHQTILPTLTENVSWCKDVITLFGSNPEFIAPLVLSISLSVSLPLLSVAAEVFCCCDFGSNSSGVPEMLYYKLMFAWRYLWGCPTHKHSKISQSLAIVEITDEGCMKLAHSLVLKQEKMENQYIRFRLSKSRDNSEGYCRSRT